VARGTQHRKRRPRPNARTATSVAAPVKPRRQKPPQWQEQLFFSRLRVHAKWVYVFLAVAFALTFALLGVGSGSTGISGALQNFFSSNGGSGPSISGLESKTQKQPSNAAAWRALATAYEQKHRTSDAVNALQQYTALRPKDQSALQELAAQYTAQATTYSQQAQQAQAAAQVANPTATFAPSSTSPLGKVFTSTTGLSSPIGSAAASEANTLASAAIQEFNTSIKSAETTYQKLAKLAPNDASTQIQLGQAAQSAGDTATAVAAYKKFLKLAPTDPLAPQVRSVLKQLAPAKK
jgi:tetratricopeptide (TPR) repeat protein